jgi:hypothetical protein
MRETKSRRRWAENVAFMGDMRRVYKIFAGIPLERSRPSPRRRWEDNIGVNLKIRVKMYGMDSSGSGQGAVSGSCEHVMKLRFP